MIDKNCMTFAIGKGILNTDGQQPEKEDSEQMSFVPKPHEIYKHFKGNLYQITAIAEHSETGEQMVVYQALYGDFKTYVRPLDMFVSRVDKEKYPEVSQEFRFELQGTESARQKQESGVDRKGSVTESVQGPIAEAKVSGEEASQVVESEEANLDPMLLEFLDADTYEQRLNILVGAHHRITQEMLTTMAVACDIELKDGELEDRFAELKNCLLTLERFECNRLR